MILKSRIPTAMRPEGKELNSVPNGKSPVD
jgi:hypothetical protein